MALPDDAASFQSRLGSIYDSSKPVKDLIGRPFGGVVGAYEFRGIDPGSGVATFADAEGNTVIGYGDPYAKLIDLNPKYYGGISNQFTYKGFALDIFLEFKKQIGKSVYSSYGGVGSLVTAGQAYNLPVEVLGRWQKPGDNASFQKFSQNYSTSVGAALMGLSDIGYTNASYLRLKNVALSYELPISVKQKLHLQNFKLYVNMQNVLTITKYKGTDPESQNWTSLPPMRTIQTGIQLGF